MSIKSAVSSSAIFTTEKPVEQKAQRIHVYLGLVMLIYVLWGGFLTLADKWSLFETLWPVTATMALGSFVAGATPQGGATVAFPVFTKVLQIPALDARTFGLMIQAVGMTMAAVLIWARRIPVLPKVIIWVTVGGSIGVWWGAFYGQIPAPYPKILFTFAATAFGIALFLSRWVLRANPRANIENWNIGHTLIFLLVGLFGGAFAANTGAGTDLLAFVVLTLAFGVNEKVSTPTTVVIMGLNSIAGFFVFGVLVDRPIGPAWDYWLAAIPIVIIGAPLGAFFTSIVKRDYLIYFIISLIVLELSTTIWLIPFDNTALLMTALVMMVSLLSFGLMLFYRTTSQTKENLPVRTKM